MGRKAKRMNKEQARTALAAAGEAFKSFNSIHDLIDDCYSKKSYVPQRYTSAWCTLQRFLDLMELEVERACLG